jgi:hypothetical protein
MARWCEFANPARRWLNKLLILPLETAKFFNKKRIQKLPDPVFEALADLNLAAELVWPDQTRNRGKLRPYRYMTHTNQSGTPRGTPTRRHADTTAISPGRLFFPGNRRRRNKPSDQLADNAKRFSGRLLPALIPKFSIRQPRCVVHLLAPQPQFFQVACRCAESVISISARMSTLNQRY